jgi:hypothetical protein
MGLFFLGLPPVFVVPTESSVFVALAGVGGTAGVVGEAVEGVVSAGGDTSLGRFAARVTGMEGAAGGSEGAERAIEVEILERVAGATRMEGV